MQVVETPVAGEVRHYQMLIGGAWVNAQSGRTFESINPYTGKVWAVMPEAAEADVDAGVCSEGLTTKVQPAASAGASLKDSSKSGEFQGVMAPTTPIGSRRV